MLHVFALAVKYIDCWCNCANVQKWRSVGLDPYVLVPTYVALPMTGPDYGVMVSFAYGFGGGTYLPPAGSTKVRGYFYCWTFIWNNFEIVFYIRSCNKPICKHFGMWIFQMLNLKLPTFPNYWRCQTTIESVVHPSLKYWVYPECWIYNT